MGRWFALTLAAAALGGCTMPGEAVRPDIPTRSPRREALSYFPAGAPLVMVVETDPQDPGLRRLAGSGALAPLRRAADARKVFFEQVRGLLGNDAVVGLPHPGAPLAVVVTRDGDALATFARARVLARTATRAGTYRGTRLYAERGWAFGVRDEVLLAAGSVPALTEALDTRVSNGAFEAARLNAVLPRDTPPATFVRGYVDLGAAVQRAGPVGRAVPLLGALGNAGFKLGASDLELRGTLNAPLDGGGLTATDVPVPARARGRRPMVPAGRPAVAVADLAPVAAAAEQALAKALPVTALKLAALRERLRVAGVALEPDLFRGSAVVTTGPMVRLDPRRPAVLAAALARAARGLKTPRLRLRRAGRLYAVTDRGRVVARVGMVGRSFVAGRGPAGALLALARAGTAPLDRAALLRLPRAAPLYPRPVVLALSGAPKRLRVDAFSGF